jgi:hypothetical protein
MHYHSSSPLSLNLFLPAVPTWVPLRSLPTYLLGFTYLPTLGTYLQTLLYLGRLGRVRFPWCTRDIIHVTSPSSFCHQLPTYSVLLCILSHSHTITSALPTPQQQHCK